MKGFRGRKALTAAVAAFGVLATVAVATGATSGQSAAVTETLVIDRSFEIKTADPQRAFEPTAQIVDRGIYDTLFTYNGGDLAHPRPLLVQSWTVSKDAKTFVFNLQRNVRFADGTPLTAADAVFSFRRLINLKGNPSFLLDGVTVSSRGRYTVVLRSKTPNLALPSSRKDGLPLMLISRLNEKTASAAVSGVPSAKRTSRRRLKTNILASLDTVHECTSSGRGCARSPPL